MRRRLVAFDLDDTLVPSDRIYGEVLAAVGVSLEQFGAARAAVKSRAPHRHVSARNRLLYFKAMLERDGRFSSDATLTLMARYERELESAFRAHWTRLERAGLMHRLRKECDLALLTNENTRTQLLKVRAFDPDGVLFPIVITSEEMFMEKPAREIFEELVRRSGRDPRDLVMVGDDWDADLAPARAAGMQVVLTTEFTMAPPTPADVPRVERLDALPAILANLPA